MRILVLGAGGVGGYFGGRLAAAGVDVTFLVRPRRAGQLARDGLVIRSPLGDARAQVKTLLREQAVPGWDAIILSCKAYDLEDAIATIRPAAAGALIIPQLNGIRHLDVLDGEFGAANVAGGAALIGATLDPDGTIRHINTLQGFIHGARCPAQRERLERLQGELLRGGFGPVLSDDIVLDMWEKFVLLCSIAGICCLLRANVGQIARTRDGASLALEMLADCVAVAGAAGFPPRPGFLEATRQSLTDRDSANAPSMLRDLQRGGAVEAEQIVGDMLARAEALGRPATLLRAAYAQLQAYQAQGTAALR
jgi:2-dehydropantoate 2-reductase